MNIYGEFVLFFFWYVEEEFVLKFLICSLKNIKILLDSDWTWKKNKIVNIFKIRIVKFVK